MVKENSLLKSLRSASYIRELFQDISQNSGSESLRRYSDGRSEDSASRRSPSLRARRDWRHATPR